MKLEIVSMIKVNGVWIRQEELSREELKKILGTKIDEAMGNIGFDRRKTA